MTKVFTIQEEKIGHSSSKLLPLQRKKKKGQKNSKLLTFWRKSWKPFSVLKKIASTYYRHMYIIYHALIKEALPPYHLVP